MPLTDPLTYWVTTVLSNGIEMFVKYKYNNELKKFEITLRSQLLINKALELNYNNREWVKKELDKLAKELGVFEE